MDPVKLQSYPEGKDWNAAVCSNFVKAYAVDEQTKGDIDDWNVNAWAYFYEGLRCWWR